MTGGVAPPSASCPQKIAQALQRWRNAIAFARTKDAQCVTGLFLFLLSETAGLYQVPRKQVLSGTSFLYFSHRTHGAHARPSAALRPCHPVNCPADRDKHAVMSGTVVTAMVTHDCARSRSLSTFLTKEADICVTRRTQQRTQSVVNFERPQ